MGYESKLIIVDRHVWDSGYAFAEMIAEFRMCCLPWNHREIFKTPIDFDLYVGCEAVRKDCYGEHCKMAKPEVVVDALEKMAREEDYRRYNPIIQMLKGFDSNQWEDLEVVHYGY